MPAGRGRGGRAGPGASGRVWPMAGPWPGARGRSWGLPGSRDGVEGSHGIRPVKGGCSPCGRWWCGVRGLSSGRAGGQGSAVVASARVLVLAPGRHGRRPAWRERGAQHGTVGAPWGLNPDGAPCPDRARANVGGRVLVAGQGGVSTGCVSVPDSSGPTRTARVGASKRSRASRLPGWRTDMARRNGGETVISLAVRGWGRRKPSGWARRRPSKTGAGVGTGGRWAGARGVGACGSGRRAREGARVRARPCRLAGCGPWGCGAGQNGSSSVVVVGRRSGRLALTLRKPR
ncbi:hypothetical protein KAURM247S_05649 [Kitasatospora aureofaciens]